VDTRIPDNYIADMSQRLRTYKRIASARSDEELNRIADEAADRYGRLPMPVENLFRYARVRREAERLGVVSIDRVGENLSLKLGEKARVEPGGLLLFLDENKSASFSPTGVLKVKLEAGVEELLADKVFAALDEILGRLQKQ
jgi:transcription-repair coupling factor (superfamily II helicase)